MFHRTHALIALLVLIGVTLACSTSEPTQLHPSPVATVLPSGTPLQPEPSPGAIEVVTPSPESDSAPEIDAYVQVEASKIDLKVGETMTITGRPVNIGQPYYYLVLRDEGVQDNPYTVMVTLDNQITPGEGRSQVLEFVSAKGGLDQVEFVLRAIAPGVTAVDIEATGEVHFPDGSATFMGSGSGSVLVIIGD